MKFGEMLKQIRLSRRLTLRECARALGVDCSNWSKVERSINQAPLSMKTLTAWADFFALENPERQEFFDAAYASRGLMKICGAASPT